MLREHGLGSIPGTAAEILDDSVREILSHKKVDVAAWVEIITTAHTLGVPTTSTIMYGHVESPRHVVNHLSLLRDIQKHTHGFTEFVPLRFIHQNTVLFRKGLVAPPRPRAARLPHVRLLAAVSARADRQSPDLVGQDGRRLAALTLKAGCNDFSGTLMEESITRAGRRRRRRIRSGRPDRRESARDGPHRRRTHHALQKALRKKGSQWRAGRSLPSTANDHHACGGSGCS